MGIKKIICYIGVIMVALVLVQASTQAVYLASRKSSIGGADRILDLE